MDSGRCFSRFSRSSSDSSCIRLAERKENVELKNLFDDFHLGKCEKLRGIDVTTFNL